jgi:hypothetical protein
MPQAAVISTSTLNNRVIPLYPGGKRIHVNIPPGTTIVKGTVIAHITSSANAVQTISDTPTITAGTFTISGTNPLSGEAFTTADIAYNASAATVATAVQTALGHGGTVTGAGGALPGTDVTLTFSGAYAGRPVELMTVNNAGLTGGTLAIAATTVGRSAGTFAPHSAAVIAAPTTAPTVAGNGSGSSFGAGTYGVSYTWTTAAGETTPSPVTFATITAAQNLRVSAITAPTGAVNANYYVNGVYAGTTVVSSGTAAQTDLTGASITVGRDAPDTNTAYTTTGGTGTSKARGIMEYTVTSRADGRVYIGTATDQEGEGRDSAPMYYTGTFRTTDLTGLTDVGVADLGRLISGTVADGILALTGS